MSNTYQKEAKRPVSASAVVRIVIWSVVLCILLGLLGLGLLLDGEGTFMSISLGGYGYRYDESGFSVGDGSTDQAVTDIAVDWVDGSVTIVAAEGDEILISEDYTGDDTAMELRWKVENGRLTVKFRAPLFRVKRTVSKNLTLAIPSSMLEKLGEVEVDGVDCDVRFTGNADEVSLDVVDGSLTVTGDVGELDLNAVNGSITFSGGIRKADVECVDADVVMHLDMARELNFDQVDGDVTLYLSEEITGFAAEVDGLDGEIQVEGFESYTTQGSKSARWGDGGLRIEMNGVDCKLIIEKETKN